MLKNLIYPAMTAGVFGVDTALKRRSRQKLRLGESRRHGKLIIRNSSNSGAFMNALEKKPEIVLVLSFALTAVCAILFLATLGRAGSRLLKAGLALLLGGAFSNTYDRLRRKYVTDYISFDAGSARFRDTVFNIGDFAIAAGALFVIADAFRE